MTIPQLGNDSKSRERWEYGWLEKRPLIKTEHQHLLGWNAFTDSCSAILAGVPRDIICTVLQTVHVATDYLVEALSFTFVGWLISWGTKKWPVLYDSDILFAERMRWQYYVHDTPVREYPIIGVFISTQIWKQNLVRNSFQFPHHVDSCPHCVPPWTVWPLICFNAGCFEPTYAHLELISTIPLMAVNFFFVTY